MSGVSAKHLASGNVHIIAEAGGKQVKLTVTKEYARDLAVALLGAEYEAVIKKTKNLGDILKAAMQEAGMR